MTSFTATFPVNMSNERDWAANLGMLDWDATSIVFTKRSLMEFLKTTGVTVDTNFANIQKLPRYATFGKISDGPATSPAAAAPASPASVASAGQPILATPDFKPTRRVRELPGGPRTNIFGDDDVPDASSTASSKAAAPEPVVPQVTPDFKPTRRVRELPGGPRTNIFGDDDVPDALSTAPPKAAAPEPAVSQVASPSPAAPAVEAPATAAADDKNKEEGRPATTIKPSRRVREAPGGNSSLSSFWGNDEPEEFKPTRRVRQAPGGGSTGIF
ncbi:hypothetical protein C8R46DRAFT_1087007 [Mycena filopes]|nr:hypothetical protein C8R46DRAFT_1087007 [Mycena filopes]